MKSEATVMLKKAWLEEREDEVEQALLSLMRKQAELDKKLHALVSAKTGE